MNIAHSKLTAQGQISVPAEVRRKLGVGPGAVLEWVEEAGRMVVRKAGRFSSVDVHQALFGTRTAASATPTAVKEGIGQYIRRRHARG